MECVKKTPAISSLVWHVLYKMHLSTAALVALVSVVITTVFCTHDKMMDYGGLEVEVLNIKMCRQ